MPDDFTAILSVPVSSPRPGERQRWHLLGRLETTAIARRTSDNAVLVRREARPGSFLFGPFWRLPGGRYVLAFRGTAARTRLIGQPVLGVEVVALNRHQQAWRDFTAEELAAGGAQVDFEVPSFLSLEAGEEARFEFRFIHLGTADLTMGEITLRQLGPEDDVPVEPWSVRLLGRFNPTALSRRQRNGAIRVPRFAPPGIALQGAWPYLRLPEGGHRLRLSATPGKAARQDRPVIAIDIIGHSRWRRGWPQPLLPWRRRQDGEACLLHSAEFRAAEFRHGKPITVDFVVPPELGLESGEDIPFEIRVRHLGNGGFSIREIDLRRLDEDECEALSEAGGPGSPQPLRPPRRNVLLIGNCQADTVRQGFRAAEALNRRFRTKYHFVGLQKHLIDSARRELAEADILIVQDIADWESYPLREEVPAGVEIIKFPLLHLASPWPFDRYNGPGDTEAYEREWPNLTFLYQDGLLGRLRRQIPNREERFEAYRELALPGIVNIARLHDFERRRLLAMDRRFGFEIGAYILDRIPREQVFYTTNHPNGRVIARLMEWVMRRLGVDEPFPATERLDHLRRLQVPVHPKVAETLGLAWATEATRYRYEGRLITWEEYTRAYIEHYG